MLELHEIEKSFGPLRAVDGVSLTLTKGQTTALIGPSGCGKSTLLRIMIGLITPDSGRVELDGTTVTAANARQARRQIGYAIKSGGLFPHLTAHQNVALPARQIGWDTAKISDRIDHLSAMMHLTDDDVRKFPSELSGGQRQRVALMRALMLDPKLLLLDEPLGALDPVIRGSLQEELGSLFAQLGTTAVLVTHDLAEAAYLAPNDIVLLRDGSIEQRGAFSELQHDPASDFVAEFIRAQTARVAALIGGRS